MVRLTLSIRKSLEDSASQYFEAAKKARRKKEGATRTIERFEKELPKAAHIHEQKTAAQARKQEWYERFRWSFTVDGVLLVGGRDATGNEAIIKRHLEPSDTVFHTEAPASPFVLLKGQRNEERITQAAQLCASYSAAWKAGLAFTDVFWVLPEQVTKEASAGEYLSRGAFMVRGEKHFIHSPLELSFGLREGVPAAGASEIFSGSVCAVVIPGKSKPSEVASKLAKKLGFHPDDWLRLLPAGGCTIKSWQKKSGDHNS